VFAWCTKEDSVRQRYPVHLPFLGEAARVYGTKLNFNSAYHPQTDGQTKWTNQILEDMLRACALKHGGSWDKSLPYAEFSYNKCDVPGF
jgi:hypothetical protein